MSMSDGESEQITSSPRLRKRGRLASGEAEQSDSPRKTRGMRRTLSVTRAEEIQTEARKARDAQPDLPIHYPNDSLFSWSSGFSDFTGLVNWGAIFLALGSFRLLLENFIKYGIRIDPWQWLYILSGEDSSNNNYPSIYLLLTLHVFVYVIFTIETLLSREQLAETFGFCIQVVTIFTMIVLPIIFLNISPMDFSLFGAITVTFSYTIMFLKMWSYVQVNYWCREYFRSAEGRRKRRHTNINKNRDNDDYEVVYPDNLSFRDLYYFIAAPTLCYELNFPRSSRIRKRFVLKRILEVIFLVNLVLALFQQWVVPVINTSIKPFSEMSLMRCTERLLKLSLPNHLIWLMFFYAMFHSFMNFLGEVLMFADRCFYKDWWNAVTIEQFWRNWNIPVHRWAVRHLYTPMIRRGFSRLSAMVTVFFFSAFFHEYLVSVPLRMFRVWAFMGMMAQVPLAMVSKSIVDNRAGNIVVWASLILGQPLAILMYCHDYVVYHHSTTLSLYNQTSYL